MPLDPHAASILQFLAAVFPDVGGEVTDAAEARRVVARIDFPRGPEVAKVEYRTIPGGIGVRIYWPRDGDWPHPVVVYFHGGGFVVGGLDTHDGVCRMLCADAQVIVISVDYRLAPEHRYPAAVDDAYAAACWAVEHAAGLDGDPARVVVAGDSSGGTLAAVTCQRARDEHGPDIAFQLLICPATDLRPGGYPSRRENADGYFLTEAHIRWYAEQYLKDPSQAVEPRVAPMCATDFSGLPPGFVMTAEFDPLRDEGEAYAARIGAGYRRMDGLFHGFWGMGVFLPLARSAELVAVRTLRDVLTG